jgi:carbamoyl-phosphate synthase small subunit
LTVRCLSNSEEKGLRKPALLALADGTLFWGESIGVDGQTVGEVVFNTAITGYQEILTDPSYRKQIVTLTYPHIGNVGINSEDSESSAIHVSGLVVRDVPLLASSWRSESSLEDYLTANQVVAIAEIDTRQLTRILREKGAQAGCIVAGDLLENGTVDEQAAIAAAQAFPGLQGMDLAQEVTTTETYSWAQGSWTLKDGLPESSDDLPHHVVVYDYGVKSNILRMLVDRGCRLTVVPAQMPAAEVQAMNPDGVFLSNGPGDPEPCDYALTAIKTIVDSGMPVFGICLGHQLLSLASGARTMKMKFGHHGANHPVQDLKSGVVMITSQNHGFAVDADSLPINLKATHRSLFDHSLQGVERDDKPAFSFQGHPEASPGPHDVAPLFDHFIELIEQHKLTAG